MREESRTGYPAPRTWSEVFTKMSSDRRVDHVPGSVRAWMASSVTLDWYLCAALTAIGAVVRYALLYAPSLTIDEGSSLIFAYAPSGQLIRNVLRFDTHPPLYYLTVHYAYYLLHLSPIDALRLPSFLAGTLTVAVMYAIARALIGRLAAVVAALLTICSPIAIWYSHDGRMYAMTWLFVLLSYLMLVLVRQRKGWIWVAAYAVAVALALYADISSWLSIGPQVALIGAGLVSAYLATRSGGAPWRSEPLRVWGRVAIGFLSGWALFLPWLIVFPEQLALIEGVHFGVPSAQVYWLLLLNDLGLTASYAVLTATVPPNVELAMLAAFIIAIVVVAWAAGGARYRLFCAVTAALTVGVAGVFALAVLDGSRAVLIPRVIGIGAFGFILLAAGAVAIMMDAGLPLGAPHTGHGAGSPLYARWTEGLLAAAMLLTLAPGMAAAMARLGDKGDNGSRWNTIAAQIVRQASADDVVLYYPLGIKSVIDPYLPVSSPWRVEAKGLWPVAGVSPQPYFQRYLPGHTRIWFLFYSSSQITMPLYDGWIQQMGYCRSQGDPAARYGMVVYVACSHSSSKPGSLAALTLFLTSHAFTRQSGGAMGARYHQLR